MKKKTGRPRVSDSPPFEQLLTQAKMTNAFLAAQLSLHMTQQSIVGLLRGVGASPQQIAEVLGTSYASVSVSLSRIRKQSDTQRQGIEHGEPQEQGTSEDDLREAGEGLQQQ
jgi:DNA-directed RNA polymerase specialized sigma24 family protein